MLCAGVAWASECIRSESSGGEPAAPRLRRGGVVARPHDERHRRARGPRAQDPCGGRAMKHGCIHSRVYGRADAPSASRPKADLHSPAGRRLPVRPAAWGGPARVIASRCDRRGRRSSPETTGAYTRGWMQPWADPTVISFSSSQCVAGRGLVPRRRAGGPGAAQVRALQHGPSETTARTKRPWADPSLDARPPWCTLRLLRARPASGATASALGGFAFWGAHDAH